MRRFCLIVCAAVLPLAALAAEPPGKPATTPSTDAPPPPPMPRGEPPAESGLEPEVTITTRGDATHEEYRANGKLYMIKVTPKRGKPYYLVDHQGTGQFQRSDLEQKISVPQWVIKSW